MKIDRLKKYLENYFDTVINPKFLEKPNDDGIESFLVYDIVKGSYNPPIIHVFVDTIPITNHPLKSTKKVLSEVENDVKDFMTMFSLKNPVKIHINKRPLFKPNKTYSKEI